MNKKLLCCICGNEIKKEGCLNYIGHNPIGAFLKGFLFYINKIIRRNIIINYRGDLKSYIR